MDKYNNITSEQLLEAIKLIVEKHENKKLEITNLTVLVDKKIDELTIIESEYATLIALLNEKNKNVRQEIYPTV